MADEAKDEAKKEITVPDKFKALVAEIEKMSVLDLSELVKVLEEKFGVSAAAPVAVMAAAGAGAEAAEEKSEYTVELTSAGDNKIGVIKVVRELTGLGLKEAKDVVDANGVVMENAPKDKADEAKKALEAAGAKVELQ